MTDQEILSAVKQLIDACLKSGLIHTLEAAAGVEKMYSALKERLSQ